MVNIFNYIDRPSPIHRLTGATKLVATILWTLAAMITYDTRILLAMPIISFILFRMSKIKLSDVKVILIATVIFMVMNNVFVFIFSPQHGVEIYMSKHVIFGGDARYAITQEQLFYHLNLLLKYFAQVPMILLFVSTTEPSEFAASMNKIGVSYKISYAIALALRYIPDIQREYVDISQAQQARGIEMSSKESLVKRLKAASQILIPLILSSMDRIEVISNAMELRGFGKNRKRTWYVARKFTAADYLTMALSVLLLAGTIVGISLMGTRFYNPFI